MEYIDSVATATGVLNTIPSMQRCMGNFPCFLAVTAGSAAIGQWLDSSGIVTNPNPTSSEDLFLPPDIQAENICTSNCYYWHFDGRTFPSATAACRRYSEVLTQWQFSRVVLHSSSATCYYRLNGTGQESGIVTVNKGQSRPSDDIAYTRFSHLHAQRLAESAIPPSILLPLLQAQHQNNTGIGIQPEKTGVTITGTSITSDSPVFTPDTNKVVTTETIKNPDGSTSTKETTKQTHYAIEAAGDGQVKVKPITTTEVKVDGVPVPELGKTEDGKTNPEQDIETCGLPNTPACKINEEGTPEAQQDTHKQDVDNALSDLNKLASNPASFWPTLPEIRWDFALPTGCAAIAIPAFEPWLQEIDVCQFQPIFHDIMSAVWVLGGLFGAISIFWRSTFAKAA